MKKIVFVIGSLENGGAERVVSVLTNFLAKKNEVHIVTTMEDKIDYEINDKVTYKYIMDDYENEQGIKKNFFRIFALRNYFNTIKPDVIISFLWATNIVSILACMFTKHNLILSERNDPNHEPTSTKWRMIRNCLFRLRKRNYFVFQTQYAQSCFSSRIRKKSQVIFNPIKNNLPKVCKEEREKKIVCVARFVSEKNIDMLLRAFKKISYKEPDFELHLYGRGPLEQELKAETKKLGIEKKVIFKGFSKNIHDEIRNATVFVLPSNYEGISNAMLEALAIGIPSICTDCPAYGTREFIQDGYNGYLINVGDEESLYEKCMCLIENKDIRDRFSLSSVKINELLNVTKICNQWEEFINRII